MNPWTSLVDALANAMVGTGNQLGGNVLAGIFAMTLVVRLVLIPIMLPLARKGRVWRDVHRRIKPEIKAITAQYKDDPSAMGRELKALHQRNGIGQVDTAGLLGALIQLPIMIAFFQAVIEMSKGTPLGAGGLPWGVAAGAVSLAGSVLGDPTTPKPLVYMAGLMPIGIAAWLGSGVGAYLVAFYVGSLVQSLLTRRRAANAV